MSSQHRTPWGGNRYALPSLVAAALLVLGGLAHHLLSEKQVTIADVPKVSFTPHTTVGRTYIISSGTPESGLEAILQFGLGALASRTAAANAN
jgi:hypothetical protein